MIDSINEQRKIIKEGYGITDDSKQGPASYQKEMLELDKNESVYKQTIEDNNKSIVSENAIIRVIHLERLKTHDMVDASKQADKIIESANKNIIGMMIEDVKENIDDKFEENQEKAKKKEEEKEKLEEKIEAAKAESKKTKDNDNQDEMYKLNDTLNEIISKKQNSTIPDIKKSLEQIIGELKLTSEDLKGSVVDEDIQSLIFQTHVF